MKKTRIPWKTTGWTVAILLAMLVPAGAANALAGLAGIAAALPDREVAILLEVGREYDLAGNALKLLLVIRKIENGGPGIEMGVGSDIPGHRSRRYAGQPDLSLRTQARWAAGTIRDRYTGDLEAFARRYCPPQWRHWTAMARHWMTCG